MVAHVKSVLLSYKELIFQIVLHVLVFIFYSFDKNRPQLEFYQVIFFLNYAIATFFINYFLLPRFYYRKNYLFFFFFTALVIASVIVIEELVLEQIFFPDTRGKSFPGVFFSLFEVLPVITIISGFKFAWDAIEKQQEVDHLKATIKESELQFLTSQINPHFLFNNLNNLYAYAIENSPKTPQIILELSSVLRYMLYECKSKFVPLQKEIEQLENFTRLNQLQIEERGEVNFKTTNIKPGFQIAPLILIVFIENAFKHSQASQSQDIFIDIELKLSDTGMLEFICKNNFLPVSNTENLSKGIGLENVKKRLELLYSNTYELNIQESDNNYEVYVSLRLNKSSSL